MKNYHESEEDFQFHRLDLEPVVGGCDHLMVPNRSDPFTVTGVLWGGPGRKPWSGCKIHLAALAEDGPIRFIGPFL